MYHYCLGLMFLAGVALGQAVLPSCYSFMGNSCLEFTTSSLDISHNVSYKLKFITTEPSGILLYAEGEDDYEGLFIFNGRLVYLLTNPSPSGVEGTMGGFYQGNVRVNNNTWVTVEMWRNYKTVKRAPLMGTELRTGFAIYDQAGNMMESHLDHFNHRGVVLRPTIYVGGISPTVVHAHRSHVPAFKGQIREIKEEKSGLEFTSYSVNTGGKVERCS